jgi:hypothetical protein
MLCRFSNNFFKYSDPLAWLSSDASLMPLVVKLRDLSHLIHLDLSYNKIDDSSEYLMDYLRDENCTLQILVLNGKICMYISITSDFID